MHDTSELKKERDELAGKLSNPRAFSSSQELREASKRYSFVEQIVSFQEQINELEEMIKEHEEMAQKETDPEMAQLATETAREDKQKMADIEKQLTEFVNPTTSDKEYDDLIMEIRAGVGGDEAALFAQNLLRMYTRYAERKNWKFTILDSSRTEIGGIKEAVCEIHGKGAFSRLEYESGVHRVQRIPETEKAGRVHTSTASVAILPKAKPIDIQIRQDELQIDVFRASGPGGQYVNKTSSAVRVTHIPTGTVVASQAGRSQAENKEIALTILRSRILQEQREKEEKARGEARRSQIGSGERSEKIRTYNIPQDRVTDHRINENWHNITAILDGDLDEMLDVISSAAQNEK
ncbi:MAG: peptide chain release factor 1 [Candidatus Spechtbacteria bacterium]|nr:peptide chain release factor 1 [Candidatus Spechtbacteria bacterium]